MRAYVRKDPKKRRSLKSRIAKGSLGPKRVGPKYKSDRDDDAYYAAEMKDYIDYYDPSGGGRKRRRRTRKKC